MLSQFIRKICNQVNYFKSTILLIPAALLLFVVIGVTSCQDSIEGSDLTSTEESSTVIKIDVTDTRLNSLSQIVDKIEYITLEETDQSLIGDIGNVIATSNRFLIQDGFSERIYAFTKTGEHLFTLNKKGDGPGEYENLNQMSYDFENDQIVVTSNSKIIWYDENGKFIREMKSIFAGAQGFQVLEGSWLAFFMIYTHLDQSKNPHNLCILDENGDMVRKHLPLNGVDIKNTVSLFSSFHNQRNSGLLSQQYSNDLISVSREKSFIKFKLDFMNNNLPEDFEKQFLSDRTLNYEKVLNLEKENKWAHLKGIAALETKSFLNFSYSYDGQYVFCIYDKLRGTLHQYDATVRNDIGGLETLYNYSTSGDSFISFAYSSDLIESVNKGLIEDVNIIAQIRALPKNENPVLRLVKFN